MTDAAELFPRCRDAGPGVDPAAEDRRGSDRQGIPTRADFFNPAVAQDIRGALGGARAVIAKQRDGEYRRSRLDPERGADDHGA